MKKRFQGREFRRDILKRKYISHLKKNLYWLWLDDEISKKRFFDRLKPKNWKELDEGCKFAKKLRKGGNFDKYDFWTKKFRHQKAELKKGYPKDREIDDEKEIEMMQTWPEDFCGMCDHFNTDECPYKDKVDYANNWKKDIRCDNFWD